MMHESEIFDYEMYFKDLIMFIGMLYEDSMINTRKQKLGKERYEGKMFSLEKAFHKFEKESSYDLNIEEFTNSLKMLDIEIHGSKFCCVSSTNQLFLSFYKNELRKTMKKDVKNYSKIFNQQFLNDLSLLDNWKINAETANMPISDKLLETLILDNPKRHSFNKKPIFVPKLRAYFNDIISNCIEIQQDINNKIFDIVNAKSEYFITQGDTLYELPTLSFLFYLLYSEESTLSTIIKDHVDSISRDTIMRINSKSIDNQSMIVSIKNTKKRSKTTGRLRQKFTDA